MLPRPTARLLTQQSTAVWCRPHGMCNHGSIYICCFETHPRPGFSYSSAKTRLGEMARLLNCKQRAMNVGM